jgi:hypothetical protein
MRYITVSLASSGQVIAFARWRFGGNMTEAGVLTIETYKPAVIQRQLSKAPLISWQTTPRMTIAIR